MTASKDEKKKDKTPSFVELKKGSKFRQNVSRSTITKTIPVRSMLGSVISNAIKIPGTEKRALLKKTQPLPSVSSDPWDQRTYYYSPNAVVAGTPNSPRKSVKKQDSRLQDARESIANTRISANPMTRILGGHTHEKSLTAATQSKVDSDERGSCCKTRKVRDSLSSVPDTVDEKLLGECCQAGPTQGTTQDPKSGERDKPSDSSTVTTCLPSTSATPSISSMPKDESCDCDDCVEEIKKLKPSTAKPSNDVASSSSSCLPCKARTLSQGAPQNQVAPTSSSACDACQRKPASQGATQEKVAPTSSSACDTCSQKPVSQGSTQDQVAPKSSSAAPGACEACIREGQPKKTTSTSSAAQSSCEACIREGKSKRTEVKSSEITSTKSTSETAESCYDKCLKDIPTRSAQPSTSNETTKSCYDQCLKDVPTRSAQPSTSTETTKLCSKEIQTTSTPPSKEIQTTSTPPSTLGQPESSDKKGPKEVETSSSQPTTASATPRKCSINKKECILPPKRECIGPSWSESRASTAETSTKEPTSTTSGGPCVPSKTSTTPTQEESTTPKSCSVKKGSCSLPPRRECVEAGSSATPASKAETSTRPGSTAETSTKPASTAETSTKPASTTETSTREPTSTTAGGPCVPPKSSKAPASTAETSTKGPTSSTSRGPCVPPKSSGTPASTAERGPCVPPKSSAAPTKEKSTTEASSPATPASKAETSTKPASTTETSTKEPASATTDGSCPEPPPTCGRRTSAKEGTAAPTSGKPNDTLNVPSKPSGMNASCQQSCSKTSTKESSSKRAKSNDDCPSYCSKKSSRPSQSGASEHTSEKDTLKKDGSTSNGTCGLPCPAKSSKQDTQKKSVSKSSVETGQCEIAGCKRVQSTSSEQTSTSAPGTCGLPCPAKSSQQKQSVSKHSESSTGHELSGTARPSSSGPSTRTSGSCGGLVCPRKSAGAKTGSTPSSENKHDDGICGPCASHAAVQRILRRSSRPSSSGGMAKKSVSGSKTRCASSQTNDRCGPFSDKDNLRKSLSVNSPFSLQPYTCKPCSSQSSANSTSNTTNQEKKICRNSLSSTIGQSTEPEKKNSNESSDSCRKCLGIPAEDKLTQPGQDNSNGMPSSIKEPSATQPSENNSSQTPGTCIECKSVQPTNQTSGGCKECVPMKSTPTTGKCVECAPQREGTTQSASKGPSKCNLLDIIPEKTSPSESELENTAAVKKMIDEGGPDEGGKKGADCFYNIDTSHDVQQPVEEDVGSCCKAADPGSTGTCPQIKCSIPTTIPTTTAAPKMSDDTTTAVPEITDDTQDDEFEDASSDEIAATTTCPPGYQSVPDDEDEDGGEEEVEDEAEAEAEVETEVEVATTEKPLSDYARRKKEPVDHKKLSRLRSRLKKQKRAPKGSSRRTLDGSEIPMPPHLAVQCLKKSNYRANRSSCFRQQVQSRLSSCGLRKRRSLSPDSQERRLRGRINYRGLPHVPVRLTHGEHLRRQHLDELRERLLARLNKRKKPFKFR